MNQRTQRAEYTRSWLSSETLRWRSELGEFPVRQARRPLLLPPGIAPPSHTPRETPFDPGHPAGPTAP